MASYSSVERYPTPVRTYTSYGVPQSTSFNRRTDYGIPEGVVYLAASDGGYRAASPSPPYVTRASPTRRFPDTPTIVNRVSPAPLSARGPARSYSASPTVRRISLADQGYQTYQPASIRVPEVGSVVHRPYASGPSSPPAHKPSDYIQELGRAAWKVLHAVAEHYPEFPTAAEQQDTFTFLHSFSRTYPCEKCRLHFQQLFRDHPPDLRSRATFSAWMVFIHDEVNASLGRPRHGTY